MDFSLATRGEEIAFSAETTGPDEFSATLGGKDYHIRVSRITEFELCLFLSCGGKTSVKRVFVAPGNAGKWVAARGDCRFIRDLSTERARQGRKKGLSEGPKPITPPMPAVVVRVSVSVGDEVEPGDPVIVVSAMKMETTLTASFKGRVERINAAVGDKVAPGDILVDIAAVE